MKKTLLLILTVLSSNLIAQIKQDTLIEKLSGIEIGKRIFYSENDTIPIVVNLEDTKIENSPLFYLNEQVVDEQVLKAFDFSKIEAIKVKKESIEFNGVNYNGKIYIKTKQNYSPKFISLNELKAKYLNISDSTSTLFLLDGEVINIDYDKFKVDENYILKIEVKVVENSRENLDLIVVKLITRTKENLKKANTIRIKGQEYYGMNKTSH